MLNVGVAKEVARSILPQSMMTEFIVTGNLRNYLHFCHLRMKPDAQKEIRDPAWAIFKLIKHRCPQTCDVWLNSTFNAMTVYEDESETMYNWAEPEFTGRRKKEFLEKCKKIMPSKSGESYLKEYSK